MGGLRWRPRHQFCSFEERGDLDGLSNVGLYGDVGLGLDECSGYHTRFYVS